MNATTATYVSGTGSQAPTLPVVSPGTGSSSEAPAPLPLAGSGATRSDRQAGTAVVPLDAFARLAGPDVSVDADAGMVRVHAVFEIDPRTRELSVSVVDEAGRLVRLIPADSVAKMIAAMAAYRGR
jgi:hypothetical protein